MGLKSLWGLGCKEINHFTSTCLSLSGSLPLGLQGHLRQFPAPAALMSLLNIPHVLPVVVVAARPHFSPLIL